MATRYRFVHNPKLVMGNGMILPEENTPSIMARRTFFTELVEHIYVVENPAQNHFCNALCREKLQIVIFKEGKTAKDLVSR